MTEVENKKDLSLKIQAALDKSTAKVIADEKIRDGYLVVSDPKAISGKYRQRNYS